MTLEEARAVVRQYAQHQWAYEVTDDNIIVVGGNDSRLALAKARAAGHKGLHIRAEQSMLRA
jgi:hypothetical protein